MAAAGLVLVIRGNFGYAFFGVATWHVGLYVASMVPLALAAAFSGLALVPEAWRRRKPSSELFAWGVLAFAAGLVLTATAQIAVAIHAASRNSPFG